MNFQSILMPKVILAKILSQKSWSVETIFILGKRFKFRHFYKFFKKTFKNDRSYNQYLTIKNNSISYINKSVNRKAAFLAKKNRVGPRQMFRL